MARMSRYDLCMRIAWRLKKMHWTSEIDTRTPNHDGFEDDTVFERVLQTANNLSEIGEAFLSARGKLRKIDYLAIATKAVHAGMSIFNTWASKDMINLAEYFNQPGTEWKLVPYMASLHAFENRDIEERIVHSHKRVRYGKINSAAWTAVVEGIEIGWTGPPDQVNVPPYIWSKTPEQIRNLAARRLWDRAGSDKIIRVSADKISPHQVDISIYETQFLKDLEWRIRKFLESNISRAFLLNGEPGCGKSACTTYLTHKLGFCGVIVKAVDFLTGHIGAANVSGADLAEMLRPDVLIVNDVDRLTEADQVALLDVFDSAKSFAKLIFATTNHYRDLIEPLRRPGRLDDLIHVPLLSLEEIEHIAPSLKEHTSKMLGWPVVYVRDMQDRYSAMGEVALAEFDLVTNRLQEVREDGEYTQKPAKATIRRRNALDNLFERRKG